MIWPSKVVSTAMLACLLSAAVQAQEPKPAGPTGGTDSTLSVASAPAAPTASEAVSAEAGRPGAASAASEGKTARSFEEEPVVHARQLRWERLFDLVLSWDRTATKLEKDKAPAPVMEAMRTRLENRTRLSSEQCDFVRAIAREWKENLLAGNRRRMEEIAAVRATHPGERLDRYNSAEIRAVLDKRWKLTDDALEELLGLLGRDAFDRLEAFSQHEEDEFLKVTE